MAASRHENQAKPRRGRPPADPDAARSERVVTFLTRDQMNRLKNHANAQELSVSAACAAMLDAALKNVASDSDSAEGSDL